MPKNRAFDPAVTRVVASLLCGTRCAAAWLPLAFALGCLDGAPAANVSAEQPLEVGGISARAFAVEARSAADVGAVTATLEGLFPDAHVERTGTRFLSVDASAPLSASELAAREAVASALPGVAGAFPVWLDPGASPSDTPVAFVTSSVAFSAPGADGRSIAQMAGGKAIAKVEPLPYGTGLWLAEAPTPTLALDLAERLRKRPEIGFVELQVRRQHTGRAITDPLFPMQWHLANDGSVAGTTAGVDLNLADAWVSSGGEDAIVAVIDDGVERAHPDLLENYAPTVSFDFNDNDCDPIADPAAAHGTSVAGVLAAPTNGVGGVGVAHRAMFGGFRLIAAPTTDADDANALASRPVVACAEYRDLSIVDIKNNSWGPNDNGKLQGPGELTRAAIEDGVSNGRHGLGTIYVWAGGNGAAAHDDCNYDGYANSPRVIAVGAFSPTGTATPYAEPGACLLVSAPSSAGSIGILTTDLTGSRGVNNAGDYTSQFGGTSASAPMVSGVAALLLTVNPALSWRDVQHIFVETAQLVDPEHDDWTTNGAGLHVNHQYGFGAVDASAAVAAAAAWTPRPALVDPIVRTEAPAVAIPDNDLEGIWRELVVEEHLTLEHVVVEFSAQHPYRGDLQVELISPSGTTSVLARSRVEDDGRNYAQWRFSSVRHWGEDAMGTWTLHISDRNVGDAGTLGSWTLQLEGTFATPPCAEDFDQDGICDDVDDDDDDDGALDQDDGDDRDPYVCSDLDGDTCDDCAMGWFDVAADGPDFDGDGVCDAIDPCLGDLDDDSLCDFLDADDDGDGRPDDSDPCPRDPLNDGDRDGACGDEDVCPGTRLPEAAPLGGVLAKGRYALLDGDAFFERGGSKGRITTTTLTAATLGGCSCEQVVDAMAASSRMVTYGCTGGLLADWHLQLTGELLVLP